MLYAKYNIINGEIELNKDFINDPIKRIYLDKIIKHELEHAKQFEMIASLDYGIEKLNYALMKNISSNIKDNVVAEGIIAVNDILQKNTSKDFDNITITIQGAEVNMKKYFKGMATLLQNPNCTYKDIPMIIDKSHYLKAIEKRGPLTEEEKEKAEEYYKAYLKYNCTTSDILNPFSQKYNKNILEKDAIIASKK